MIVPRRRLVHRYALTIAFTGAAACIAGCADTQPAAKETAPTPPTSVSNEQMAPEAGAWRLPTGDPDAPSLVSSIARCGTDFFLVDRRLAVVYRTDFNGPGRRIGRQGDRPGEFQEPTGVAVDCERRKLYVVDVTGISAFESSTGRFLKRFPRPSGFSNRGNTVLVDQDVLFTSGIWPREVNSDWRAVEPSRAHAGAFRTQAQSRYGCEFTHVRSG